MVCSDTHTFRGQVVSDAPLCVRVRNRRPGSQRTGCVRCTTLCARVCGTAVLAHRGWVVSGAPLCAREYGTADLVHRGRVVSGAPLCVHACVEQQTLLTRGRVVSGAPLCVHVCVEQQTWFTEDRRRVCLRRTTFCVQASPEQHTRLTQHGLRQVHHFVCMRVQNPQTRPTLTEDGHLMCATMRAHDLAPDPVLCVESP